MTQLARHHPWTTIAALAAALSLLCAPRAGAKALLGEPEVDRASDQYDGFWCPAEHVQAFDGSFTADGPWVTLRFVATNHHMGNWRHELIDNVLVLPLADYVANKHLPDSALAAQYHCIDPTRNYFHFSDVPLENFVFFDKMLDGPDPDWDMSDGAYENAISSGLNEFELPLDSTGESMGLGLDEVPTAEATAEITIPGFTAGQQYVVSTWTNAVDASIGNDLVIEIYGTEFFTLAGAQPIDTGPGRGLAWGDYDLDGDLDLYVTNYNAASRLWRNNNNGASFTDVTVASGTALNTLATAVSWADVDDDGDLDLYVASHGANRYFKNAGGGVFVNATAGPLGDTRQSEAIDWGDYDRDGDLDLFIANIETDALLRNDGSAGFVDVASGTLLGSGRPIGCSWVDFDDDDDLDLFVTYNAQANELFVNTGGTFVRSTPAALAAPENQATAAWSDYDNDGDLDAYFSAMGTGTRLVRNQGGGVFIEATPGGLVDGGLGVESIWGDWENDGDLDLYLVKQGQPNRLFRNDGGPFGTQVTGTVEIAALVGGTAWADYDSDGDLDMHVVNSSMDALFRNEYGQDFKWVHVNLKGTVSNSFGVGAKVFVKTGTKTQMREVGGESGLRSQNSLTAEFGLGGAEIVDQIKVEWPSGIKQALNNVPTNQKITITEASSTGVEELASGGAAPSSNLPELRANVPNPFIESTSIAYSLPQASDVALRVYDVVGRVVRTLDHGPKSAGDHTVSWNARDENGRPIAPGIYFYELQAGEASVTRKMIRLE